MQKILVIEVPSEHAAERLEASAAAALRDAQSMGIVTSWSWRDEEATDNGQAREIRPLVANAVDRAAEALHNAAEALRGE